MNWLDKYSVIFFDRLDSTNLEAERLVNRGTIGEYVIVSSMQSAGQGRNENSWHSPEGNLYFSIVFNHENDLSKLPQISLVTSLSCCEAMHNLLADNEASLFPRLFQIKWPNDLLLNGKKQCGILLRSLPYVCANTEPVNYLIVGIGMNLTSSPKNLNYQTISLGEEGIQYNSKDEVLHKIMERFNENYKVWQSEGFSAIRVRWMDCAYNVGKEISFSMRGERFSGTFKEIADDGQIVLELKSGELHKVATCDIQMN